MAVNLDTTEKSILEIGDYSLIETDWIWQNVSGQKYIIRWQNGLTMRDLKKYGEADLELAKEVLKELAEKDPMGKWKESVKADIKEKTDRGLTPVPHDDRDFFLQLSNQGYRVVEQDETYLWMQRPRPESKG